MLLQKLLVPQIVKKFPTFYGTRRFITVFITALPSLVPVLSQINPVHGPIPLLKIHFDIILRSTPRSSKSPLSPSSAH